MAEKVELAGRWEDRDEMLLTLWVLLFSLGVVKDSLFNRATKRSNFDASCTMDAQLLCGAGLSATIGFFEHSNLPKAADTLRYRLKCEVAGDFDRFPPETCVALYRQHDHPPST